MKYEIIGPFPDRWLGEILIPLHFHLKSRDAIHYGTEDDAEQLYRHVVLFENIEETQLLLDVGLLERILASFRSWGT